MSDQLYTSLGGSDIHAVFGNYKFGSVSGAFVFTLIDRKGLVKAMAEAGGDTNGHVFLNNDEIANFANSANQAKPTASQAYKDSTRAGGTFGKAGVIGTTTSNQSAFVPFTDSSIFNESNFGQATAPYIADQLLPFDITIVGVPEYGSAFAKRLVIHGVEVMTEASGTSIDDLVIEKQNSFIAKSVSDWVSLGEIGGATGSGNFDRFSSW